MNKINYVIGDATLPQGEGIKVICHICNNVGAWGAGFVMALSKKWEMPEMHYRLKDGYVLGDVDFIPVTEDTFVANMIAQNNIMSNLGEDDKPPIIYSAVAKALYKVNEYAKQINATIHMPRIGTGLAGGKWNLIEAIIKQVVTVDVTVYDLP